MSSKIFLYFFVALLVLLSLDSININQIFKKNKVFQARLFMILLSISLVYLVTNFIYDFFLFSIK